MNDLRQEQPRLSDTDLRARAEARAILEDRSRPPHVVVVFVNPEHDKATGAVRPVACDSRVADVADKRLERGEHESLEEFTQRVNDAIPAFGAPCGAIMWPAEESDEKSSVLSR